MDKGPTPNINERLKFIESTMQTLSAFTKQLTQQQGTSDPFGNVINLSKHKFTVHEFKVLCYNFNFIPTPNFFNSEQLMEDISQF